MYVNWDISYATGVQSFDDQHKRLFALINNLHAAMKEKRSKEMLGETLEGLINYTKTHFTAEEMVMRAHGYPEFDQHKRAHEELIGQVNDMQARFHAGEPVLTVEVIGFLVNWLKTHIQGTDRSYGPFLNQKGVQ